MSSPRSRASANRVSASTWVSTNGFSTYICAPASSALLAPGDGVGADFELQRGEAVVPEQRSGAAGGECVRMTGVHAQTRKRAMHHEAPGGATVDREVEGTGTAEHALELTHPGAHIADMVDAVLNNREVEPPALERQRLHRPPPVFDQRAAQRRKGTARGAVSLERHHP